MKVFEYSSVTELPGHNITRDQLNRLYHRYRFAKNFCKEKRVLEVACGGGMGLGYLKGAANSVIGGDIDQHILEIPENYYKNRDGISIKNFDAHSFPFEDDSFDVVINYEAIYYLDDFESFLDESSRTLTKNGVLILCTVNKEWADFNPSPYSVRYYTTLELYKVLRRKFSNVAVYGVFSTRSGNAKDFLISLIKRIAVKLNLMPKTMKGKKLFKRIFLGELVEMPFEISDNPSFDYSEPVLLPEHKEINEYKVLYAVASC